MSTTSPPVSPAPDAHDKDPLGKRLAEAWHKTVGAWATDEKGTASLLGRLVDFRALSADEARRVLQDAKARVDENRAELDRRVDESWQRASSFFTSEQKELRRLEDKLEKLEGRVKALSSAAQ
jgi:polyhydroxyalkanoate synthesis regulator phasin